MKKFWLSLIFCMCCVFNVSFAYEMPEEVRIGLSYGSNAVSSFTLSAPSGIDVDDVGKMTGVVTFSKSGSNKLNVENSSKNKTCTVDNDDGIWVSPIDDEEFNGT